MYYREWSRTVTSRKGRMVSEKALSTILQSPNPGYSSVYAFSEESAKKIKESMSSKGMDSYPVYSDHLVLDIDNGYEGLHTVLNVLDREGLEYNYYTSGGKGYHVYIPHSPIESIDLPYSHKCVVESLGLKVDMSLYQHGRLISLPGRVHLTTGKVKEHLVFKPGELLNVPIVLTPEKNLTFDFIEGGGVGDLTRALLRLTGIIEAEPHPGNRHTAIWGAAKELGEAGLSSAVTLEIMQEVNKSWTVPKTEQEVSNAVMQAFKL